MSGGGSFNPENPGQVIGDLDGKTFLQLIRRQSLTAAPESKRWEIGTSGGVIKGRLYYYVEDGAGEVTIIVFTPGVDAADNESAVYIPLRQISYIKHNLSFHATD